LRLASDIPFPAGDNPGEMKHLITKHFTDFSLATPVASVLVNPEGKFEVEFPATGNAAF
jgi:hypothetical protein